MIVTSITQITPGAILAANWAGKPGPELRVCRVTPGCRHNPAALPVGVDLETQLGIVRVGDPGADACLDLLQDSQGRICYVYPWSWIDGDQGLGFDWCDLGPSTIGYILIPLALVQAGEPYRVPATQLNLFGGAA